MTSDQITIFNSEGGLGGEAVRDLLMGVTGQAIVKWAFVAGLVMYSLFALVIIKQVNIMAQTFETELSGAVKVFAWVHFLGALILLGAGILVL